jgi:hypothetical protein
MHGRFIEQLATTGVPTVRLTGSIAQRMEQAAAAVDACLAACRDT